MLIALLIIFWTSIFLIAYALFGFPLLLWLRAKLFPLPVTDEAAIPTVSVVIAAYNEEREIVKRIENILACNYPAEKLEILIASDGSTDATHELVRGFEDRGVKLFEYVRMGKSQVINGTIPHASGDVLVFSDANTHFRYDALHNVCAPFADEQIGGVAGNQIYTRDETDSLSADGEKSHWAFDTWLKKMQSAGGSVTSATGAIYAIRTKLFEPTPEDSMDDFMISTGVVAQGYRLVYSHDAIAVEPVATRSNVEVQRKIRVMTQGLRSVIHRRRLLNPLRFGFYAIQLFTHKVLRRLLVIPFAAILLTSPFLWSVGPVYQVVVVIEAGILIAACIGLLLSRVGRWQSKIFAIPCFFVMVNIAALIALWNTFTGRRIKKWEPERHTLAGDSGSSAFNRSTVT